MILNLLTTYLSSLHSAVSAMWEKCMSLDSVLLIVFIALNTGLYQSASAQITVFAGDDTSLCYGSSLDIDMLEATISGIVSDGNWFTTGDGLFLPSGNSMSTFSTTTAYVPGVEDQANGVFSLILVSDDPDGIGPMIEVSDVVSITYQNAPALACNNAINVTLDVQCQQAVTIDMLVSNPAEPIDRYIIDVMDENGINIAGNILTGEHIGQNITYKVGHECTQVTCSGSLTVTDNYAPVFSCIDSQIICDEGNSADEIGLPIPAAAVAVANGNDAYIVSGWDACGNVALSYTDDVTIPSCNTSLDKIINRTWIATDANGNTSYCAQSILIERITVDQVVFPPHYDGNEAPTLDCDQVYETDADGNPATSVTGSPTPSSCNHLDFIYTDTVIPLCGGGFKVLRAWEAIDWCLVETATKNQVIKVDDTSAPTFTCVNDITISTSVYDCESNNSLLNLPTNITDCSEYTITAKVQGVSNVNVYPVTEVQEQLYVDNLPKGLVNVTYTVTDECGNSAMCTATITVEDDVEPYPVCDEFTSTSITSDGRSRVYAATFDDGSTDNCEIVSYQVAKMTDECGFGLAFGDYVDFCCEEVNDTIMVAMQVTDANGNSNTCMVSVIIEDKIAPELVVPSDITISCDTYYDLEDLSPFGVVRSNVDDVESIIINDDFNSGIAGSDGYYIDNCTASVSETSVESVDCYQGTILRTFTVADEFGMSESGIQSITIQNADYIQESDIQWPLDITTTGCQDIESDTSKTGVPLLSGVTCGAIAFEFYDEIFPIADTACVKIIRHWTAIDWCQHNPDTGEGYWTDNQVIKLTNNIAPTISNCTDVEICSYDDDCMVAQYSFDLSAGDDCTDTLLLDYSWEIDNDNDGTIDLSGGNATIETTLNHGTHKVYWTVSDACGNVTTCDYMVTVKDCKAPTPYCFSSITTVLMPTTGQVTIWAEDFDFDSYDNCTPVSDLQFSFSEDVDDTSWTIDCEDIENGAIQWLPLTMYVTDSDGNQDFCEIQIVIQDNDDICENQEQDGIVKGDLRTIAGDRINAVEVEYKDVKEAYVHTTWSNEAGKYTSQATFDNVPYFVTPRKMDELTNGVTSLDLVLIQRHVLGFSEFTDPYQIIASDMNGSNSISGADIVLLRKVVLGIKSELPNGDMPWRFIPEGWVFMDASSPWGYDQNIYLEPLVDTVQHVNFTAIKLGDVNESYEAVMQGNNTAEVRTSESYNLDGTYSIEDNELTLAITSESSILADASQLSLTYDARAMYPVAVIGSNGNVVNPDDYHIADGRINLVDVYVQPTEIEANQLLYTIHFELVEVREEYFFELSNDYENVIYEDEYPYSLTLQSELRSDVEVIESDHRFSLLSNPSTQCTILSETDSSEEITITAMDATGRVVYAGKSAHQDAKIEIDARSFTSNGIYYITIEQDGKATVLEYVHVD